MQTSVIDESADKMNIQATAKPTGSEAEKPEPIEKPVIIDLNEPGEIISEDRLTVPAMPEPIDSPGHKPEAPEKPPADRQTAAAENISTSGPVYSVHAGTFQSAAQANLLINNLRSLGFPSFGYTSLNQKGNIVNVVVAGKYQSIDNAKEASRSLSEKGYSNFIAEAKDSLRIPAGSAPISYAKDNQEIPEAPLAVNQDQTAEKKPANLPVYSVHTGSFRDARQAELLLNTLRSLGFPSFMYTSVNKKGNIIHVVVAGKYQSIDLAKEASRSLNEQGYSNFIAEAKDSLRIPAGSAPINYAKDKQEISETPLAVNPEQTAEKKPESFPPLYSVHAGSFRDVRQAELLLNTLRSIGFPSFMYTGVSKKGNIVHVVVAGKYQSIDLAREASRRLTENGHSNFISRAKDSLAHGPET